jgi:hypothetical protein
MHTMINGLMQYWDATLFDYAIADYHMLTQPPFLLVKLHKV